MSLNRRKFTQAAATLPALATMPHLATANHADWQQALATAKQTHPWLIGYDTVSRSELSSEVTFRGKWPDTLRGTLYRNGPAQHQVGDFRYHHWFDGDGMLQAYRLGNGKLQHAGKLIQTSKVKDEHAAGRALYPGFGSAPPSVKPVTGPDSLNPANISVLHHHNKLLALWEAGSPWEIDPDDLTTKGRYAFTEDTLGVPFSAHPRVEADGTLWNFGYVSNAGIVVFWHINSNGKLEKIGKVPVNPISMPHDFVVTQRHIIVMMPPLHFEPNGSDNFLDNHRWAPKDPTRLLVVDKNNFDNYHWYELPAQWVFHFGNAWEDQRGVIHFDGARSENPSVMTQTFRDVMRGKITSAPPSIPFAYRIDTKSKQILEFPLLENGINGEFPAIDPRVSCQENQRCLMLTSSHSAPPPHLGFNEVSWVNMKTNKHTSYRFADRFIPEEHLYIPKPGSAPEADGWIIGTALDWQAQHTLLNVFEANHLNDGPIASAELPYVLPLGLHGKFVSA